MTDTRTYYLYDGRALSGNTEDAIVWCTADSLPEALKDAEMFNEGACYSYPLEIEDDGIRLVDYDDEIFEFSWQPGRAPESWR